MNKYQLTQVLDYLDAEYAGIAARMTDEEKKIRARHWAAEVGSLEFDAVMIAVKDLAKGQYMPRTAEVIAAVESREPVRSGRMTCRVWRAGADEMFDFRGSDGRTMMSGRLEALPEWMQLKFRWMAEPSEENTSAWDNFICSWEREQNPALMTMGGA